MTHTNTTVFLPACFRTELLCMSVLACLSCLPASEQSFSVCLSACLPASEQSFYVCLPACLPASEQSFYVCLCLPACFRTELLCMSLPVCLLQNRVMSVPACLPACLPASEQSFSSSLHLYIQRRYILSIRPLCALKTSI